MNCKKIKFCHLRWQYRCLDSPRYFYNSLSVYNLLLVTIDLYMISPIEECKSLKFIFNTIHATLQNFQALESFYVFLCESVQSTFIKAKFSNTRCFLYLFCSSQCKAKYDYKRQNSICDWESQASPTVYQYTMDQEHYKCGIWPSDLGIATTKL